MNESTDIRNDGESRNLPEGRRCSDGADARDIQGIDELLARARRGDGEAENRLFDRLGARILALAKRRVRDEEAARDIAQETMRTVCEKYRTADLPRGLLPWVFVVLRNKVGNYLKRSRVEGARRIVVEDTWMAEVVGLSPDVERAAFDLVRQLESALVRATDECRKVFRLLLGGADRHEIRAAFGDEPLGTVDSRISRCRRKLINAIESQATPGAEGRRGGPAPRAFGPTRAGGSRDRLDGRDAGARARAQEDPDD